MNLLHTNLIVITTTVDNYNTSLLRLGTERVPLNLIVPYQLASMFPSSSRGHTRLWASNSAPHSSALLN
jgi:hypothetical protein